MRNKKKNLNTKLVSSVKKVGNITGLLSKSKKADERPLTGINKPVENSM